MLRIGVLAEYPHDLPGVDAEDPEDPRHLVGEGDLGGVEGVARVLQCLGASDVDHAVISRSRNANMLGQQVAHALVGGADDDERRVEEVRDTRALAEELRAHRRPHCPAVRKRRPGEGLGDEVITRSGRHGAPHDHRVEARCRRCGGGERLVGCRPAPVAGRSGRCRRAATDGVPTQSRDTSARSRATTGSVVGAQPSARRPPSR